MRQQRCVMGVMTDPSTGPVASSDLCKCQQYFPAHPRTQCRGWWLIFRTGEVRQHDIVWASVLHFLHQYWQNSVSLLVESFHTYKWAFKHCLSVWNLDTCPLKLWKLWSCLIWRMLVQTPDCAVISEFLSPVAVMTACHLAVTLQLYYLAVFAELQSYNVAITQVTTCFGWSGC